jgi:hypothetical protein
VARHVRDSNGQGAVRQALAAALQQELNDLYRLMAVLEAQQVYSLPLPGRPPPAPSSAMDGCLQPVPGINNEP